jgi:hypothetical protein
MDIWAYGVIQMCLRLAQATQSYLASLALVRTSMCKNGAGGSCIHAQKHFTHATIYIDTLDQ